MMGFQPPRGVTREEVISICVCDFLLIEGKMCLYVYVCAVYVNTYSVCLCYAVFPANNIMACTGLYLT